MTKARFLDWLAYATLFLITIWIAAMTIGGVVYILSNAPIAGGIIGGLALIWFAMGWALKRVS